MDVVVEIDLSSDAWKQLITPSWQRGRFGALARAVTSRRRGDHYPLAPVMQRVFDKLSTALRDDQASPLRATGPYSPLPATAQHAYANVLLTYTQPTFRPVPAEITLLITVLGRQDDQFRLAFENPNRANELVVFEARRLQPQWWRITSVTFEPRA